MAGRAACDLTESRCREVFWGMSPNDLLSPAGGRLVIFGCGYVGTAFAEEALRRGWEVTALTRNAEQAERLRDSLEIEVMEADLAGDDWHSRLDPAGAIAVNCVSSGGGGEAGYAHSYRAGMESLLAWAARGPLERLVYTGSTSVYPDFQGAWVDEDAPVEASTALNRILLETESLVAEGVKAGQARGGDILRLAGIYGPGRHHLIDQLRQGNTRFAGYGEHYLNLIHRDDVVEVFLRLIGRSEEGLRLHNVSDGHPARKEAIVEWTAEQLRLPRPSFHPELRTARQQRRQLVNGRPPHRRIDSSRLRAALDWHPRYPDYRAGYRELLEGA